MFDRLSQKLGSIFTGFLGKGKISESDIDKAMVEVKDALLEADVALSVIDTIVEKVKDKAKGAKVVESTTAGQTVVKIVNDTLIEILGESGNELNLGDKPPVVIEMVGLQGSGKTTTTAKLAKRLKEKQNKKVLMASLDVYRPAAQEQLKILGEKIGVDTLPIVEKENPEAITKRALAAVKKGNYDVLFLDTAGRLHTDKKLMDEAIMVKKMAKPSEVLLVVDSMMGQDAANVAKEFSEKIGITGTVLTRLDGDARGGAAISMRLITGQPIKFYGTGEKIEDLEPFHADRLASRILGMGDIISLVEHAADKIEQEEAEKLAERMEQGVFTLEDMLKQIRQIKKMGNMSKVLGFLPGIAGIKDKIAAAGLDDTLVKKQEAVILSMTAKERRNPEIILAKRKQRIAKGSGTTVKEVEKLIKQYETMQQTMKKIGKMGGFSKMFGDKMPDMDKIQVPPGFKL